MPFKSEAQRKKFILLEKEGKLAKGTVEKWSAETGKTKLPERASKKPRGLVRQPRRTAK
jgi:hypothetical protein